MMLIRRSREMRAVISTLKLIFLQGKEKHILIREHINRGNHCSGIHVVRAGVGYSKAHEQWLEYENLDFKVIDWRTGRE